MSADLVLHQFPPALGLPVSESPPCAKVEAYLRLTETPYTLGPGDTRRSPNKMVPYVQWPDGSLQGESGDIIARIEESARLDEPLSDSKVEHGRALAERVEEHVYDACLYDRFVLSEGWAYQKPVTQKLIAQFLPRWTAPMAAFVVRRQQIKRALRGVMSDPEHGYSQATERLQEVEELLRESLFICGDTPGTADCAIWANVVHAAATPNPSPLRRAARESDVLHVWMLRFAKAANLPLDPEVIQ